MIWVAWRLNRAQVLALAALTLAGVAFLLYVRSGMLDFIAENHMAGCVQEATRSEGCIASTQAFGSQYSDFVKYLQAAFATLPVILGMFCGGPLFARELEQGTHVLALTQSVSRTRWFALKTAMALLPAIAATAMLTAALWALISASGNAGVLQQGLYEPLTFDTSGVAPVAYTFFAVVVGLVLGIARRHTVTAMAGTLAAFAVARFVGESARPWWITLLPTYRILGPADGSGPLPDLHHGEAVGGGYLKADGTIVTRDSLQDGLQSCLQQVRTDSNADLTVCYAKAGITQSYTDVLSGDHFWTAQLIETMLYGGVAVCLLAVGVWLLRKRSL
jgi:hypothetical protein